MTEQEDNVGGISVDVTLNIGGAEAKLDALERKLSDLVSNNFEVKLDVQKAVERSLGSQKTIPVQAELSFKRMTKAELLTKLTGSADVKVKVPGELTITKASLNALKKDIRTAFENFAIPVKVKFAGWEGGQPNFGAVTISGDQISVTGASATIENGPGPDDTIRGAPERGETKGPKLGTSAHRIRPVETPISQRIEAGKEKIAQREARIIELRTGGTTDKEIAQSGLYNELRALKAQIRTLEAARDPNPSRGWAGLGPEGNTADPRYQAYVASLREEGQERAYDPGYSPREERQGAEPGSAPSGAPRARIPFGVKRPHRRRREPTMEEFIARHGLFRSELLERRDVTYSTPEDTLGTVEADAGERASGRADRQRRRLERDIGENGRPVERQYRDADRGPDPRTRYRFVSEADVFPDVGVAQAQIAAARERATAATARADLLAPGQERPGIRLRRRGENGEWEYRTPRLKADKYADRDTGTAAMVGYLRRQADAGWEYDRSIRPRGASLEEIEALSPEKQEAWLAAKTEAATELGNLRRMHGQYRGISRARRKAMGAATYNAPRGKVRLQVSGTADELIRKSLAAQAQAIPYATKGEEVPEEVRAAIDEARGAVETFMMSDEPIGPGRRAPETRRRRGPGLLSEWEDYEPRGPRSVRRGGPREGAYFPEGTPEREIQTRLYETGEFGYSLAPELRKERQSRGRGDAFQGTMVAQVDEETGKGRAIKARLATPKELESLRHQTKGKGPQDREIYQGTEGERLQVFTPRDVAMAHLGEALSAAGVGDKEREQRMLAFQESGTALDMGVTATGFEESGRPILVRRQRSARNQAAEGRGRAPSAGGGAHYVGVGHISGEFGDTRSELPYDVPEADLSGRERRERVETRPRGQYLEHREAVTQPTAETREPRNLNQQRIAEEAGAMERTTYQRGPETTPTFTPLKLNITQQQAREIGQMQELAQDMPAAYDIKALQDRADAIQAEAEQMYKTGFEPDLSEEERSAKIVEMFGGGKEGDTYLGKIRQAQSARVPLERAISEQRVEQMLDEIASIAYPEDNQGRAKKKYRKQLAERLSPEEMMASEDRVAQGHPGLYEAEHAASLTPSDRAFDNPAMSVFATAKSRIAELYNQGPRQAGAVVGVHGGANIQTRLETEQEKRVRREESIENRTRKGRDAGGAGEYLTTEPGVTTKELPEEKLGFDPSKWSWNAPLPKEEVTSTTATGESITTIAHKEPPSVKALRTRLRNKGVSEGEIQKQAKKAMPKATFGSSTPGAETGDVAYVKEQYEKLPQTGKDFFLGAREDLPELKPGDEWYGKQKKLRYEAASFEATDPRRRRMEYLLLPRGKAPGTSDETSKFPPERTTVGEKTGQGEDPRTALFGQQGMTVEELESQPHGGRGGQPVTSGNPLLINEQQLKNQMAAENRARGKGSSENSAYSERIRKLREEQPEEFARIDKLPLEERTAEYRRLMEASPPAEPTALVEDIAATPPPVEPPPPAEPPTPPTAEAGEPTSSGGPIHVIVDEGKISVDNDPLRVAFEGMEKLKALSGKGEEGLGKAAADKKKRVEEDTTKDDLAISYVKGLPEQAAEEKARPAKPETVAEKLAKVRGDVSRKVEESAAAARKREDAKAAEAELKERLGSPVAYDRAASRAAAEQESRLRENETQSLLEANQRQRESREQVRARAKEEKERKSLIKNLSAELGIDTEAGADEAGAIRADAQRRVQLQASADVAEARALNPARAFQAAVAAGFQRTLGGGAEVEERIRKYQGLTTSAASQRKQAVGLAFGYRQATETERAAEAKLSDVTQRLRAEGVAPERFTESEEFRKAQTLREAASEQRQTARQRLIEQNERQRATRGQAEEARGDIISPIGVAKGFGALGLGAIVGQQIFSSFNKAFNTLEEEISRAAAPFIDQLRGFAAELDKASSSLSAAYIQSETAGRAAAATQASQARLSVGQFEDLEGVRGRSQQLAANQAFGQQVGLYKAEYGAELQNAKYGGYDRGLFKTTNPYFDLGPLTFGMATGSVGGQASQLEQFSGLLRDTAGINPLENFFRDALGGGSVGTSRLNPFITDQINEGLLKTAGPGVRVTGAGDETVDRQIAELENLTAQTGVEFTPLIKSMRDVGFVLEGVDLSKLDGIADFLKALGGEAITPELQFEADKPALEAQQRQIVRDTQRAIEEEMPRQAALQDLAQPMLPLRTGFAFSENDFNGDQYTDISDTVDEVNAKLKVAGEYQYSWNKYINEGKKELEAALEPFDSTLYTRIESLGKAIASIQAGIANRSAALQVKEYDNQLRIAKRTLGDLVALTGKRGYGEGSVLGALQKQNLELSRQAQQIQFGLQQRSINFNLAVAGLQGGGETPEERALRLRDAQAQAKAQQELLDIQKKMFGNEVRIVDEENVRALTDAVAQINLLREGRSVTLLNKADEETLQRMLKLQQKQVAEAGKYLSAVESSASMASQEITKLEIAYGKALSKISQDTVTEFGKAIGAMYQEMNSYWSSFYGQFNGGAGGGQPPQPNAEGFIGNITGATQMVVGEAGTETVAILRNPKNVPLTGMAGGGGNNVTININGPVVRNDSDIDAIAMKVQDILNTKTSLLGIRN